MKSFGVLLAVAGFLFLGTGVDAALAQGNGNGNGATVTERQIFRFVFNRCCSDIRSHSRYRAVCHEQEWNACEREGPCGYRLRWNRVHGKSDGESFA